MGVLCKLYSFGHGILYLVFVFDKICPLDWDLECEWEVLKEVMAALSCSPIVYDTFMFKYVLKIGAC